MTAEYIIGLVIVMGLAIYLIATLLNPEDFT
jgi:K+-transporting ATPase KdpF subunit